MSFLKCCLQIPDLVPASLPGCTLTHAPHSPTLNIIESCMLLKTLWPCSLQQEQPSSPVSQLIVLLIYLSLA